MSEEARQPSSHLDRDRRNNDPLESILEGWGAYRRKDVHLLGSITKSPIQAYNQLVKDFTDICDKKRKQVIRQELKRLGYKEDLEVVAKQYFREWKIKINGLTLPKETRKNVAKTPIYNPHIYYSNINRILSEIYPKYYETLIRKYEYEWQIKDFAINWGWDDDKIHDYIRRSRDSARNMLVLRGKF